MEKIKISDKVKAEKLNVASQWQLMRWKFLRHKIAVLSLVLLTLLYISVIFAGFLSPYDPRGHDYHQKSLPPQLIRFIDSTGKFHLRPFIYKAESVLDTETYMRNIIVDTDVMYPIYFFVKGDPYKFWGLFETDRHLFGTKERAMFLFGTDDMGRDMFSRILEGGRLSLSVGLVGIAVSFVLGLIIGGISGLFGGKTDMIIQRLIEGVRSMPTIPLWMALSVALPIYWSVVKVYFGIVIILSLVGWTGLARVVRGKVMSIKEEDFVMAARLYGASDGRIISRHILPSFTSYIIASLTLTVPGMILGETALSFLGIGLRAPAISWGVLLMDAQKIKVLSLTPWILMPGLFVILAILMFNFIGDGLRDAADPYNSI
ncbi:MAG: ABC transporter permease [Actinomycetia bacterium]|nr:ABC transporter permease [Actinomycetes bacterium]